MGKLLVIAEKPSVAKELAHALGGFRRAEHGWERDDAVISHARGHLVKLEMPLAATTGKNLAQLPVFGEFVTELIDHDGSIGIFRNLEKLMKRADIHSVVNACDAGREGELIFRLIVQHAKCTKPLKRMWIQSMTEEGLKEAFRSMRPAEEFDALDASSRGRSMADFLVGINASRALTYMRDEKSSGGRVQSPTGMFLYDREMEIRNFRPTDYWEIHATFGAEAGTYLGKWYDPSKVRAAPEQDSAESDDGEAEEKTATSAGHRFFDRAKADAIVAKCHGVNPSSVTDTGKRTKRAAPDLYQLTSLQQDANRKFKFPAKKTLDIAQDLYDKHKLTTYPRTDADALPEDYGDTVKRLMGNFVGTPYGVHGQRVLDHGWVNPSDKGLFNNKKISDHFAIIPTEKSPVGVSLDEDERKIYDLIVRRFMAAFHPAAEYDVTTRVSVVAGEHFKTSGRVLVSEGWLAVYGGEKADKKEPPMCAVKPGEAVKTLKVEAVTCQTKPPSRYTEAALLKAMEHAGKTVDDKAMRDAMKGKGLGTPATRADTIEGLLSTGTRANPRTPMATRDKGGFLVPTEKLMSLMEVIKREELDLLASAETTGEWEYKLGLVQKGQLHIDTFMEGIKAEVQKLIEKVRNKASSMPQAQVTLLAVPCPKCGKGLVVGSRTVDCQAGCGFRVWREVSGKSLSAAELNTLFKEGSIAKVEGFISKDKRKYSAGLKFNGEKFDLVFEDRPERAESGESRPAVGLLPVLDAPCPKCKGVIRIHGGDHPKFACEKGDFTLWRVIAQRALSDGEAIRLIRQGSMPAVNGFVGKKGKFAAGLRLSKDKTKVEFDFGS